VQIINRHILLDCRPIIVDLWTCINVRWNHKTS